MAVKHFKDIRYFRNRRLQEVQDNGTDTMKVIAITNVSYEGKRYLEGETFEHKSPQLAVEHGLIKIVEGGKESKSKRAERSDSATETEAGND